MFLKLKLTNPVAYVRRRRGFNVFHCCLQKTATQWFMRLLREVVRSPGARLLPVTGTNVVPRPRGWQNFLAGIPDGTLVTPLYIRAPDFLEAFGKRKFRAFYVLRDPRDLVISDYFSLKSTHPIQNEYYAEWRHKLNLLPPEEGIAERIRNMDWNFFVPLREWADVVHPDIRLIRYEEFFGENLENNAASLMDFLEIPVTADALRASLEKRSFDKKSKVAAAGSADGSSHYRKGKPGDWRNHFTPEHIALFKQVTGDLLVRLRYETSTDWQ